MHSDIHHFKNNETHVKKEDAISSETFGSRLCRLRTSAGLQQGELADQLHISRNAVAHWEADRARPDLSKVPDLCNALHITPNELFGMLLHDTADHKLLVDFHSLDLKNQQIILQMITMLQGMQDNDKKIVHLDDIMRVYLNSERASAGTGNLLSDSNGDYVYIHIPRSKHSRVDEIITVTGDSMEPTFHNGDELLVEHTATLHEGEIGIFTVEGQGYVKEYRKDGLHSHNHAYQPILFDGCSDVRCVGRVLDVLTPEQYATQEEIDLMEERKTTRRPRRRKQ